MLKLGEDRYVFKVLVFPSLEFPDEFNMLTVLVEDIDDHKKSNAGWQLNVCISPILYVEMLIPNVLAGGAFGK